MTAVVEATLDNLRTVDVRFLEEAARHGPLHVRVPSDRLVERLTGTLPRFPVAERLFLARSLRWVAEAAVVERAISGEMDGIAALGATCVVLGDGGDPAVLAAASTHGVPCRIVAAADLAGFPVPDPAPLSRDVPRVVVTGCYDWLHSGHIQFFTDAAAFGALHVVVGSDANVELLKGPGHPLRGEAERRYMVGAVRSVHTCLVSSGTGWMDAEPEIEHIAPAFYVVNEDGDQPEKRAFCGAHGIEYVVLERRPHAGLPARSSTELRGF